MRPNPARTNAALSTVLNYDVNTIAKMLEQQFPDTWHRMFTKSIDAPNNYYSSRALAVSLTGAIEEARAQGSALQSNVGFIAGILEKYNFPIYYVSAPLIEALKRSHPPTNHVWKDLAFPYQGLTFMLPRGSLTEPADFGGKDIMFVGVVKVPANESQTIPTVGIVGPVHEERVSIFWGVGPSGIEVNDTTFPSTHLLEPNPEWIDKMTEGRPYYGPPTQFSVQVAGLVANFLLVMQARKELVEPGSRKLAPRGTGKPALWLPTYIGRNYQVLRKGPIPDAKAHFTELGWRAGHFKNQHFGPRSEQVKTIWIDPYIAFTRGLTPVEEEV